jgi:penicillin amidase
MAMMTQLLQQPDSPWWDDVDTSDVVENRDVILGKAMQEARDELVRLQSRDPKRWTWGHLHQLQLNRPTFSNGSWMVSALFDRNGHGAPGGTGAVNATAWDPRAGYTVTNAPAMRMVVDLGDLDRSQWVNLAGQSGHAFDDHYTDQVDMWLDGRTAPWPFTADAVQRATDDTLVLKPSR